MTTVAVKFPGSFKNYHYICPFKVSKGDTVIVDSPSSGYTAVKVQEVYESSCNASKRVVDIVDDRDYKHSIETEKQRAIILQELKVIEAKVSEEERFALLAKRVPKAKMLLNKLKKLNS